MKDDELKKQEVVNAESEKQNVTTLNEKLDFSDLENVEGGTVKDFKDDEHLKSEGGNVGVGSLISEACIAKIGKQLLFSLLCIFLTDTATSRLCHLFFS